MKKIMRYNDFNINCKISDSNIGETIEIIVSKRSDKMYEKD